jgi:hypothetical protein
MNIETMKVADLMPYLRNAKKHDKKQIDNVAGYVDVIIQRWENLTGKKAVLLNGE